MPAKSEKIKVEAFETLTGQEQYFYITGNRYGYPICCIKAFIEDIRELNKTGTIKSRENPGIREKWALHGFVPCEGHAKFIEAAGYAAMVTQINNNRKHPLPFPLDEQTLLDILRNAAATLTGEKAPDHSESGESCTCEECKSKANDKETS